MGFSNIMDESLRRNQRPLSDALDLERDYLVKLGSTLGQCAEKMVCLALQDARRMASRSSLSPGISKSETLNQWSYFITAITPALDHTEMETKVILDHCCPVL
jgi:hypothetical protein